MSRSARSTGCAFQTVRPIHNEGVTVSLSQALGTTRHAQHYLARVPLTEPDKQRTMAFGATAGGGLSRVNGLDYSLACQSQEGRPDLMKTLSRCEHEVLTNRNSNGFVRSSPLEAMLSPPRTFIL